MGGRISGAGETLVALLRGINVGGRNKVAMQDLVALFQEAGARDVRTYVQSGNVVFRAAAQTARKLPGAVRARMAESLGIQVPVLVRSAADLDAIVHGNPFPDADPAHLHVVFLADLPAQAAVSSLDPARSLPDEFVVVGREIYLRLPSGVAGSKLTNAYLDSRLGTVTTARNWRTTLQLRAMALGG